MTDGDDTVRRAFGKRLAAARLAADKTQADVAGWFGVNKNTVSAWETGRGLPDAMVLRSLAKQFNVSADELLALTVRHVQVTEVTDDAAAMGRPVGARKPRGGRGKRQA